MFDCLYSILLFSWFLAYISKFCQEHNIPPLKQSEMTDVFEMQISNHKKLSKKPAKKKEFWNIGCPSFVAFFKKYLNLKSMVLSQILLQCDSSNLFNWSIYFWWISWATSWKKKGLRGYQKQFKDDSNS